MRSGLSWERGRPARSGPKAHPCVQAGKMPALPGIASTERVDLSGETQNENWRTMNDRLDNAPQYELTAEQQALKERARALAREAVEPRAAEVDRTEQYPWDNVEALRDAGFMGMTIPGPGAARGEAFST